MRKFILKKNNKAYSLKKLARKDIKATTKIRYEDQLEWTSASEIPELKEMIALNASYADIRPSIEPHIRRPNTGELICLGILLPLIQLLVPVAKAPDETNLFTISVSEMSPAKMYVYLAIASIIFLVYVYNIFTNRYFRLVKIKEQNDKCMKSYYQIQTCVSFQKQASNLDKDKLRWSAHELRKEISKKADAKEFFDRLTVRKVIREVMLSEVKLRTKKPSLFEKLKQDYPYVFSAFENELSGTIIFVYMVIGFVLVEVLMVVFDVINGLSDEEQIELYELTRNSIVVGVPVLIIMAKLYMRSFKCYARVVEINKEQGVYEIYYNSMQYLITRKKLEEIRGDRDAKWKEKILINKNQGGHHPNSFIISNSESLLEIFHKQTKQIVKLTEEAMD